MITSLSKDITASVGLRSFDPLNNYSTNRWCCCCISAYSWGC